MGTICMPCPDNVRPRRLVCDKKKLHPVPLGLSLGAAHLSISRPILVDLRNAEQLAPLLVIIDRYCAFAKLLRLGAELFGRLCHGVHPTRCSIVD